MASITDIMHIGITGLNAAQTQLNVASQNISNANTPNYSRRVVDLTENPYYTGVGVADIQRIYSDSANQNLQASVSNNSGYNILLQQIQAFAPVFDTNSTSVGTYITSTLDALNKLNLTVSTPASRQLYMSSLSQLASQIQSANGQINQQIQSVNTSLQSEVAESNNIIQGLYGINKAIASSGGQNMDQLLDQQQGLIQQLAKYFNFSAKTDSNGQLDLSLSNGLTLLQSINPPTTLTTMTDPANPANQIVAIENSSGLANTPIGDYIQSGEITGWTSYRDNVLETSQHSLNRLAMVFSQTLNAQNQLGLDGSQPNAKLGGDIFNDINSTINIANRAIANTNNTGSGMATVNITNVSSLTTSDYTFSVGAGGAYTLTRISDGNPMGSGTITGTYPQTITTTDGFSINLTSGTFNTGDQFIISPTNDGANEMTLSITDASQLALGWPVTTSPGTINQGSDLKSSVSSMTSTTTSAFSTAGQLSPPVQVKFSVAGGVTTYSLYNSTTSALIEGPITYTAPSQNIFPTPGGYDPGYRVAITGNNIQNNDTFNIQYNSNSSGDNRNGEAMAALYGAGVMQGDQTSLVTFNQGYNLINSDIAVKGNAAQTGYNNSTAILQQAQKVQDSISGVSLEEETLNLDQFQTAYQASAQILTAAKTLLDTIIQMAR